MQALELKIDYVPLSQLKPFDRNARKHDEKDVKNIAQSIDKYGFNDPIGVWGDDNVIVEGHGRFLAAKKLKLKKVPVLRLDHLTDAQRREYAIAHNATAELSEWDESILDMDLPSMDFSGFDFDFLKIDDELHAEEDEERKFQEMKKDFEERMASGELSEDDEEYQEFIHKFDAKKTTDDCYTPPIVYDAVADYVAERYGVKKSDFVRPFVPGGDYQNYKYKPTDVVVDNPPFSILSEIVRFYHEKNIKCFLFAPHLTLFSGTASACAFIVCGVPITYENGAVVNTSFITNMEDCAFRSAPKLYRAVTEANDENLKQNRKVLPKYSYPKNVMTSAMMTGFSRYGIDFEVGKNQCAFIRALDSQKESGKGLFGSGFLISNGKKAEREKAEREKAEVWELSERELAIIDSLEQ